MERDNAPVLPVKLAISSAEWDPEKRELCARGWVLGLPEAAELKAEADGIALGEPIRDLPRPDVHERHPAYGERHAGYAFTETLTIEPGANPEKLTIKASDREGNVLARAHKTVSRVRSAPAARGSTFSPRGLARKLVCNVSGKPVSVEKGAPASYTAMRAENRAYKYLFPNGDLTTAELEAAEREDTLLVPLVMNRSEQLIGHLSEKYGVPPRLLWYLLEMDLKHFRKVICAGGGGYRVENYARRVQARLEVFQRNAHAIKQLLAFKPVKRDRFFDVGCLFGASMVSAAELGFACVHGCELDPGVLERGRAFTEIAKREISADYAYYAEDIRTLDLEPNSYNLVTVVNVLEHTPKLDETIARLAEITAPDGLIYIFQNAFPSLYYVFSEPHYRIPLVMILPEDLRGRVLKELKLKEVVTRWPDYTELMTLFERYGLKPQLHEDTLGIVETPPVIRPGEVATWERKIRDAAEAQVRTALDPGLWREAEKVADAYFRRIAETVPKAPEYARLSFFMRNWHFTLTKNA